MGLEGLLQFNGAAKWQSLALGFAVGGVCGAMAGKWWTISHPSGEAPVRPSGVSQWLLSWRFQVLTFAVLFLIAVLPPFAPIFSIVSPRSDLQAGIQEGLAGLFLVFGMVLTLSEAESG
jgi:hypothetical protein